MAQHYYDAQKRKKGAPNSTTVGSFTTKEAAEQELVRWTKAGYIGKIFKRNVPAGFVLSKHGAHSIKLVKT